MPATLALTPTPDAGAAGASTLLGGNQPVLIIDFTDAINGGIEEEVIITSVARVITERAR